MPEQFFYKGEALPLKTIAERAGINYSTLRHRALIQKWSIEKAISSGVRACTRPNNGVKTCAKCKETKPIEIFHKQIQKSGKHRYGYCLECVNSDNVKMIQKRRMLCLTHYSVNGEIKCALCPERRIPALDIDHIAGCGMKKREREKMIPHLSRFLIKKNFPEGFRILCRNCNWIEWLRRSKSGPYWEYKPRKMTKRKTNNVQREKEKSALQTVRN